MASKVNKTTKNQKKATKTEKKGAKKVTRIFNANSDNIDAFRSRLGTSAAQINALFIKNPKKVYNVASIVKITKLKKSRVSVHLYWASKTFDHIKKVDGGYKKK